MKRDPRTKSQQSPQANGRGVLDLFMQNAHHSRLNYKENSFDSTPARVTIPCLDDNSAEESYRRIVEDLFKLSPTQSAAALSNFKRDFLSGAMPVVAPRLYANRPNPSGNESEKFLLEVWGPWVGRGLFRPALRKMDPGLVKALENAFVGRPEKLAELLPKKTAETDARLMEALGSLPADTDRRQALTALNSGLRPFARRSGADPS